MKVGILSDTHMMKKFMDKAIPYLKKCNLIIHAGDNFSDSKYIHNMTGIDIMAVKGNCDFEDVEEELIFEVEGKTIFLCHGDKYGTDILEEKAKKCGADVVIFGHTHTPLQIEKDDILYINLGSVSLPRQVKYKSFIIMDIQDENIYLEEIII